MRVDQVITLVWAANVLLLGGTGWVGWQFWEQKQAQKEKPPAVEWPEGKQGTDVPLRRWPGPVTNFRHVWETPFNGLVPPPPPPPDAPKVEKIDPATAFRNRVQLITVVEASEPFATMIQVNDTQGGQKPLVVGQKIDEWQLVRAGVDRAAGQFRAVFANPGYEKGEVEIVAAMPKVDMPSVPAWKPSYEGPVNEGTVPRDRVEVQAIRVAATGEWMVPVEETDWWAVWGEADVLRKTKFVERPNGGLEVASMPPRGPLDNTRGVTQGDVIISINDTPVKSLAGALAYVRGPGRDLTRFVVVIERDGARRTQVYNVSRRRNVRSTAATGDPRSGAVVPSDAR
jgi:hypothetical protein